MYAGGWFHTIGGQTRNLIAALDVETGLAITWNPNANNIIRALAVSGMTVYAGGNLTSIGGKTRRGIAALDAPTGLAIAWNPNANGGSVYALVVSGKTVYAGGSFTTIGGQLRGGFAQFDEPPTPMPPRNPGTTAIGINTITWTWQDNSSDETGFKVYDDPGTGTPATLQTTTAAGTTSWQHNGLSPNTQYAFEVAATNANGDSPLTVNFTAWTLAEVPVALVVSNPAEHSLDISIGADANPAGTLYAIEVSPAVSGNTWVQADGSVGATAFFQTSAAWATNTVTGLAEAMAYTFTVTVQNGAGVDTAAGPGATLMTLDVPPSVTINQQGTQADPTNTLPIVFDVVFSEEVTGFDASDVVPSGTAMGMTFTVMAMDASHYTVSATAVTDDGTVQPTIRVGGTIDAAGNDNAASTSTDNSVTLDWVIPTVVVGAPNPPETENGPVTYELTYSEPCIISLSADDIELGFTDTATGEISVSGSGDTTRTVTIQNIFGLGTLWITVSPLADTDLAGNFVLSAVPSQVVTVTDIPKVPVAGLAGVALLMSLLTVVASKRSRRKRDTK